MTKPTTQEIAKAGTVLWPQLRKLQMRREEEPQAVSQSLLFLDKNELAAILAALRLLEPVAAGTHMIVPKEPTDHINIAIHTAIEIAIRCQINHPIGTAIYRSMIAAAQEE